MTFRKNTIARTIVWRKWSVLLVLMLIGVMAAYPALSGQAADGNGPVTVHVLFRKSEGGWQHIDVHAQFLTHIPAPSSPDCSFTEHHSP